jgi:hypothetical protein
MPSIRLPESAEVLLPFCRRHDSAEPNACFETYADLVVFAASLGYHRMNGCRPSDPTAFISSVYPIDIGVFKNQGLYPNLLLIGLGATGKAEIARDEESLCRTAEAFADIGCKSMTRDRGNWPPGRYHLALGEFLERSSQADTAGVSI